MFSHIPDDVFCTQINGNVEEALKVLNVRMGRLKSKSRTFEWEFSSFDPENPITQVSKTPSDEETCDWINGELEDEKVNSHQQLSNSPRSPVHDSKGKLGMVVENEEQGVELVENEEQAGENEEQASENEEQTGENEEQPGEIAGNEDKSDLVDENDEKNNIPPENNDSKPGGLKEKDENEDTPEADNDDTIPMKWIKTRRPTSIMKTKPLVKDVIKFIDEMKKQISREDLDLRVIPSPSSSRFELPIDLTRLEGVGPLEFVSMYCRVAETRRAVYAAKYEAYRQDRDVDTVFASEIRELYEQLFQEPTLVDEMLHLRRLLDLDLNEELDVDLFTAVSCVMERIIVKNRGLLGSKESKKNVFEVADFCSLNGKLHGVNISTYLRNLLEFIRNA